MAKQGGPLIGSDGFQTVQDWFGFEPSGQVQLKVGKVELGQGILTALAQIAAAELGVDISAFTVVSGNTATTPNEGYTGSSLSVEISGLAVLKAARSAKQLLISEAARTLNAGQDSLTISGGEVFLDGKPSGLDIWCLAGAVDLSTEVDNEDGWSSLEAGTLIGRNIPRIDLQQKISAGGFIHDIELPDMLHGRILRPPSFSSRLIGFDKTAFLEAVEGTQVWLDGSFIGIVAEGEYDAVCALERAGAYASWSDGNSLPYVNSWADYLMQQDAIVSETEKGERRLKANRQLNAVYSKPPIAHASVAPSCALAHWLDGKLTVWSSTQGVFALRSAISTALGIEPNNITVIHSQSAGCYGHNGAEDAAMDAVLLAQAFSPRPVRVQWTHQDELSWSPFGSPMAVALNAGLDEDGNITDWSTQIWSGTQVKRPGFLPGLVDFVATDHLEKRIPFSDSRDVPYAFVGGDRNAETMYEIPYVRIVRHHIPDLPLRLSSLRALGGFANVFAGECFMDELAELAGCDPVEFRLRHLTDQRARRVIETVAELADWQGTRSGQSDQGQGIGFARYKNTAAYTSVVAEVELDDVVRVRKLTGAVDAGLVINPNGVLNQIEGGALQAMSWTLLEQVSFDSSMVTTSTWDRYPILTFQEIPDIHFEIVGGEENDPLGVGEAAQGPTAAAIANAIAVAAGIRIRDLPINRDQVLRSVSQ